MRYHFIWQKHEDGDIHTLFRRSEDNRSDVMTKNVAVNLFQTHLPSMQSIDENRWREDVARYKKDILEIGQRGHHHGLGPCEAINIPTENGSSDEKDHAITSESREESWDKDIRTVETIKTKSGNESLSEKEERNDLPGKKESKSGDSQLRDQGDPEGLTSREDYLPER